MMLPLKLVRSLVLGETMTSKPCNHHRDRSCRIDLDDDGDGPTQNPTARRRRRRRTRTKSTRKLSKSKTPLLFFVPTRELVSDTYRLAVIARDMGLNLYPTPSLSHIIFSFPPSGSPSSASPPSFSSSHPSSWSSLSLSSSLSWSLPNAAVLLSFPSLSASSLSHLRSFVSHSKGLFKLVFLATDQPSKGFEFENMSRNWDCCSVSLFSRITGDRIDSMEAFSRVLAGAGWTLYKAKRNQRSDSADASGDSWYLFRKVYSARVRGSTGDAECRVRELRLPLLDFKNAPLRILQYVVLMTVDVFFLA